MNTEKKVVSTKRLALLHFYIGAIGFEILFSMAASFLPTDHLPAPVNYIASEMVTLAVVALSVWYSVQFLSKRYQIQDAAEVAKKSAIFNARLFAALGVLALVVWIVGANKYEIPPFDPAVELQYVLSAIGELIVFYLLTLRWLKDTAPEATSS